MPNDIEITLNLNQGDPAEVELNYPSSPPVSIEFTEPDAPVIEIEFSNIGPKGEAGADSSLTAIAGQDLSSGRLVYIDNGQALYYNPNDVLLYGRQVGITKNAALNGAAIYIQLSGVFEESGLGLTNGSRYYAGINGSLVTSVTGLSMVVPIGHAISTNKLSINFYSPIKTN